MMPRGITIELKNLLFFAYHGLYAEEKKTGNQFEVILTVDFIPGTDIITDMTSTVNYEQLYALLKAEMQKPRDLLETLIMEVAEHIHSSFPQITKIEISITKLQPPIVGFTGTVGLSYCKVYHL